jgi:hypothetical protein
MSSRRNDAAIATGYWALAVTACLIGAGAYNQYQIMNETACGGPQPVIRSLDTAYNFKDLNVKLSYPYNCNLETYDFNVRAWSIDYRNLFWEGGTWSTTHPSLQNNLLGKNFLVDQYRRLTAVESIRAAKTEFYRMQLDICTGLPADAALDKFGVLNHDFPQSKKLDIKKSDVKKGFSKPFGDYEEAEKVYLTTSGLEFYAKQRVYIVGRNRYVLTFTTKNSMLHRVEPLGEDFIENGLQADLPALLAPDPLPDAELLGQARAFAEEAAALEGEADGLPNNAAYRALLRWLAAINLCERMSAPAPLRERAFARANKLRGLLQSELERLRREAILKFNCRQFDEADARLGTIRAILDSEGDSCAPAQRDEWLDWADEAEIAIAEERAPPRRSPRHPGLARVR